MVNAIGARGALDPVNDGEVIEADTPDPTDEGRTDGEETQMPELLNDWTEDDSTDEDWERISTIKGKYQ